VKIKPDNPIKRVSEKAIFPADDLLFQLRASLPIRSMPQTLFPFPDECQEKGSVPILPKFMHLPFGMQGRPLAVAGKETVQL
jgi:hypothetical protein